VCKVSFFPKVIILSACGFKNLAFGKAGFRYGDNAPMAIIEFVDRDVEAKRIDKKKKETNKETTPKEEKKLATA